MIVYIFQPREVLKSEPPKSARGSQDSEVRHHLVFFGCKEQKPILAN